MDKSEQIKKLKLLVEMLEGRDKTYLEHTRAILDLLAPTLLTAIKEFFGIGPEQVQWHEVKTYNASIILLATLLLEPPPELLQAMASGSGMPDDMFEDAEIKKVIRISVPGALAFETKEKIVEWLESQEIQHIENGILVDKSIEQDDHDDRLEEEHPLNEDELIETSHKTPDEFDPRSLSKEQIAQMLFFQHETKGTKQ